MAQTYGLDGYSDFIEGVLEAAAYARRANCLDGSLAQWEADLLDLLIKQWRSGTGDVFLPLSLSRPPLHILKKKTKEKEGEEEEEEEELSPHRIQSSEMASSPAAQESSRQQSLSTPQQSSGYCSAYDVASFQHSGEALVGIPMQPVQQMDPGQVLMTTQPMMHQQLVQHNGQTMILLQQPVQQQMDMPMQQMQQVPTQGHAMVPVLQQRADGQQQVVYMQHPGTLYQHQQQN